MHTKIKDQVKSLLKQLTDGVYEKEQIMAMALLSAVAGESIFLLGPPGTAKSLVARRLKNAFNDAREFEYLMSRFSTPDEIFGPVSISLLKNEDKYERVVDGYLPTATVVFLDEIWKAGPAIQNSLLTAINEKLFQNGSHTLHLPMKALIAASNELPAENEGLEALWDRFLIRIVSNNIQSETTFYNMVRQQNVLHKTVDPTLQISDEQYAEWSKAITQITIPDTILEIITCIRKRLATLSKGEDVNAMDYYVSDRRWKKCIHLLQTSAFLNGRHSIDVTDIAILFHCLWNKAEHIPTIVDAVAQSIVSPIEKQLVGILRNIKKAINKRQSGMIAEEPLLIKEHDLIINTLSPMLQTISSLFSATDNLFISKRDKQVICKSLSKCEEHIEETRLKLINTQELLRT